MTVSVALIPEAVQFCFKPGQTVQVLYRLDRPPEGPTYVIAAREVRKQSDCTGAYYLPVYRLDGYPGIVHEAYLSPCPPPARYPAGPPNCCF